jgi:hypothetical protein
MSDERDSDAPSLEPPSLFGRKKRKKSAPAPVAEPSPEAEAEVVPPPAPVTEPVPVAEPVVQPPVEPEPEPELEPTVVLPPAPTPEPALESAPEPEPEPVPAPEPVVARSPLTPPPAPPREPRAPRDPWLVGPPAAVLTGLLVGGLIVAATAGGLRVCTAVKGTSSCGNPGFLLLCAILVVAVLVGGALLRSARVPQPGSTSFLAVGLLSVVALLFLVGQLFAWWMAIVIPLVSVATFLLSYWVTTTYIEPDQDASDPERQPESYDVR